MCRIAAIREQEVGDQRDHGGQGGQHQPPAHRAAVQRHAGCVLVGAQQVLDAAEATGTEATETSTTKEKRSIFGGSSKRDRGAKEPEAAETKATETKATEAKATEAK